MGQRSAVLLGLADGRSLAMLSAPEGSKAWGPRPLSASVAEVCCCGFSEQGSCVVLLCDRQVHVYQAPAIVVGHVMAEAEGGSHLFNCSWSSPACGGCSGPRAVWLGDLLLLECREGPWALIAAGVWAVGLFALAPGRSPVAAGAPGCRGAAQE